ncbi:hypothetical protein [Campylobacter sp. RM12651]|uniref:hypothetical protein n=1 Tax=Campylobacter sp. RM12651 TaxID=1660079 RepID=UPI001EFC11D1|nr:hypothetical protein [Campylobacter sp. RM12651]ULO03813.1 hypothetical protein AVBRAN_1359 [Campylobacter sp. RM12651]
MTKVLKATTTNLAGIDTIRSIIPTYTLEKFLTKHNISVKQKVPKNIKEFAFKELKNNEQYTFAYLDNQSVMIICNKNKELDELCVKRKKRYTYYSYVIITSLHQPQRSLSKVKYKIASLFIKRFKLINCDIALDYKTKSFDINTAKKIFYSFCKPKNINIYKGTIYVNQYLKQIKKIILYDKYKKETEYHNKKLSLEDEGWKRLETTIAINTKLKKMKFNQVFFLMSNILNALENRSKRWGINLLFFKKQLGYFFDNRRSLKINFKIRSYI